VLLSHQLTARQEHHLQAAISASQAAAIGGTVAHIYIPTPETVQSAIQYDELYFLRYDEPATYIRFSSTVEDCCGCPYNLTEEDDLRLAAINERRNASTQCSENQFEELMYLFEETAKAKQPFAAVDNPPVIPWEEMESAMDDAVGQSSLPFAQEAYDHWKSRRLANGNNALTPGLKLKLLESATDADDNDPYVCFRRREVRQIRKTRGRDAQSAEKLKKLRQELESARQILAFVRQRELLKRDQLAADQLIFEHRTNLRQSKRNLPDQYRDGDDDLLINQKVCVSSRHFWTNALTRVSLKRKSPWKSPLLNALLRLSLVYNRSRMVVEQTRTLFNWRIYMPRRKWTSTERSS
jgi:enhancer of polycomb-like protein